ncbi:MAG: D-alanyl-D-alanine carboxypeptidase [Ruminococcaceae bacterium]|nr:D-alanyl-D-alanine carboxypeptidase [Oscillospiraceae bacterium]
MKKIRTLLSILLCSFLIIGVLPLNAFAENNTDMKVEVMAKAAVLMDMSTGEVIMAKNENEKLFPASVTKIMSLLLIFEALDNGKIKLDDTVTVSKYASSMGGSEIWLEEGEQMTAEEMIKAICVASANDACVAMSEFIAGSNDAFVELMNKRASELGMNNTTFVNCTGLDDTTDDHLTTAYDIALMSRELMKHEKVTEYTTIWMDSLRNGETLLTNTNKLVRFYDGCTGLKTGTTAKAGCCLSATATRNGTSLIAVVLGSKTSEERFEGAKAMLNWGFSNLETVTPEIEDGLITKVGVRYGLKTSLMPSIPDFKPILIEKGNKDKIEQNIELPVDVEAPVEKGQIIGKVIFKLNDEKIGEYSLVSEEEIPRLTFTEAFLRILRAFKSKNS